MSNAQPDGAVQFALAAKQPMTNVEWICVAMLVPPLMLAIVLLVGIARHFAGDWIERLPSGLGERWRARRMHLVRMWNRSHVQSPPVRMMRPSMPAA